MTGQSYKNRIFCCIFVCVMEYLLITIGVICLIIGLAGCVLPVIPGPPIAYAGILCLHFTDAVEFTMVSLVMWGVVVALSVVLDNMIPVIGTKFFGGSRWGTWGCVVGTLVGLFAGPVGVIIGPFLGALVGELLGRKPVPDALKSAFGSFLGFLCGTLLKLVICVYFIYESIVAIL